MLIIYFPLLYLACAFPSETEIIPPISLTSDVNIEIQSFQTIILIDINQFIIKLINEYKNNYL